MKKSLLSLFAFLLTATAVNAQKFVTLPDAPGKNDVVKFETSPFAKQKKVSPKRDLAKNQRYIGLTGSDSPAGNLGVSKYYKYIEAAGSVLEADKLKGLIGTRVIGMRILLYGFEDSNITGFVKPVTEKGFLEGVEGTTKATNSTIQGNYLTPVWNEIKFNTPLTIESNEDLLFGFKTPNKNVQSYLIGKGDGKSLGMMIYGPFDNNSSSNVWASYTSQYALCMQLIVEKDTEFVPDLDLSDFHVAPFGQSNNRITCTYVLTNNGNDATITDYSLGFYIDGKKVYTFDNKDTSDGHNTNDFAIDASGSLGGFYIPTPVFAHLSNHTLSMKIEKVNGATPVGNLDDDSVEEGFVGVTQTTERQKQLFEHFTSQYCVNCPNGYDAIRKLTASRDDVAWVALHGNLGNYTDDYYTEAISPLLDISGSYPTAAINRYAEGDKIAFGLNYGDDYIDAVAKMLSNVIDNSNEEVPSFVKLGISSSYDNGKLTFTVYGQGVEGAAQLLKGATLTNYITQDGLVSKQANGTNPFGGFKYDKTFNHENVLRAVVTNSSVAGDVITWDGDNFTMSYEYDVPTSWHATADKLRLTSFVSMPFWDGKSTITYQGAQYPKLNDDIYSYWVNQCETLQLNQSASTGVKGVENNSTNATVVARYAVDGTQISAPVKGINILKMSDGTTRKVLVNK